MVNILKKICNKKKKGHVEWEIKQQNRKTLNKQQKCHNLANKMYQ